MKQITCLFLLCLLFPPALLFSGGISIDAGLTPAQDRWIFRTQYRYMAMNNANMTSINQMIPFVLAYGITSDITVMVRSMYVFRKTEMNTTKRYKGFDDIFLLTKFKVYRKNTANYIFGIAPFIASNIPVGISNISDRTWNPQVGLSISFKPRFWSVDLMVYYTKNDLTEKNATGFNDELSYNIAFSGIIPIGNSSELAFSPVLEITYNTEIKTHNKDNPVQSVLFTSPGFQFIRSSIVLEALYQIPIYQEVGESNMKSKPRIIVGIRFMF